jgi:altronate dehydratase small subunit
MEIDAIVVREEDNVATALRDIGAGEEAIAGLLNTTKKISVYEDIPYGHKFAVQDIRKGEDVVKYGEVIGRATRNIPSGAHAHIQNIESLRGRGDWEKERDEREV